MALEFYLSRHLILIIGCFNSIRDFRLRSVFFSHRIIIIEQMNKKFWVFVLTSWSYGSLEGTASAFAMTKDPMKGELGLTESYLGNVDSVTIIGTIVGTFLMINLTKSIKKYFLLFSFVHALFFCMLTISDQIPEKTARIIIMICMFIVGVAKASVVFPQILFSNFFDSETEKFHFNLWYGLTFLGDTCGILISKFIISKLMLGWQVNIYFFSFILCLSTVIIYCVVEDPPQENVDSPQQSVRQIFGNIRKFLEPMTNKLIAADFALQEVLYNNIILWMPYSFEDNGLAGQDYIATLSFPIMIALGALFIEYPLTQCETKSKYFLIGLIAASCFSFFLMMVIRLISDNVTIHIILLAVSGFLMGSPYSRVCSGDPAQVCEGDPKKIHTAFFTINFMRYICSALTFHIIGKLLEKDKGALQKINFITIMLILVVGIIRRFFFPFQPTTKGQESIQEEELQES